MTVRPRNIGRLCPAAEAFFATLAELGLAAPPAGPGPPGALKRPSCCHSKLVLGGGFVWARRALNSRERRFAAPRATTRLVFFLYYYKRVLVPV
jgi:hypothetical protein